MPMTNSLLNMYGFVLPDGYVHIRLAAHRTVLNNGCPMYLNNEPEGNPVK